MLAFYLTNLITGGSAPAVVTPAFTFVMWWDF